MSQSVETQNPQEALRALAAKKDAKRPKRAQLRQLLPDIEAAQAAGVSNAEIVETLNSQGIEMTLSAFQTALSRIRNPRPSKRRAADAVATYRPATPPSGGPTGRATAIRAGAADAPTGKPEPADLPTHGPDGLPLTAKQKREQVADQFVPRGSNGPLNPRLQKLLNKDTK